MPRSIVNKLLELAFDEEKLKISARHFRNPKDFNEICELISAKGDTIEATANMPMHEQKIVLTKDNPAFSTFIDAPVKEITY